MVVLAVENDFKLPIQVHLSLFSTFKEGPVLVLAHAVVFPPCCDGIDQVLMVFLARE